MSLRKTQTMPTMKYLSWLVVAAATFTAGCGSPPPTASPGEHPLIPYRVQFGWTFDAHHLGFLLAQNAGFYREAGLDVTLSPGGLDSSPVRTLLSGGAELAQISGAEQLLAGKQEGLPIVGVAAFHRVSPHALVSLARRPVRTAADLRGARIAVAFGDTAEYLLRDYMAKNSINADEVTLTPFRFDLSPLIDGSVDAVTGFATDQPHTLKNEGLSPVVLQYSTVLQAGYGYMFVAQEGRTQGLEAFLKASRRGWQAVFVDQDRALDVLLEKVPSLNRDVERGKLASVQTLMLRQDKSLADWCIEPDVIREVQQRMLRYGQLKSSVQVAGSFSNEYCQ